MLRSKFPTGAASAASLTSAPGSTTARGAIYIKATFDDASIKRITKMLHDVEPKIRRKIAGTALRKWGAAVRKVARQFAWRNAARTKRQLTVKVKSYKRAVWAGVGVKTERVKTPPSIRQGRNSPFVGWKSHFYEVGWHAWPKGVSGNSERVSEISRNARIASGGATFKTIIAYRNGKPHTRKIKERVRTLSDRGSDGGGRGWRRGIRGRLGSFQSQYATHYLFRAASVGRRLAPSLISESIAAGIKEAQKVA